MREVVSRKARQVQLQIVLSMDKSVIFAYPEALSFSGQTAATELAIDQLSTLGWTCHSVKFIALDRSKPALRRYVSYVLGILRAWFLISFHAFRQRQSICFNHSQSFVSFLRMGIPHLFLRWALPNLRIVTSLHGNVFMTWNEDSREMKFFLKLLAASDVVTVLGEDQQDRLRNLGVPCQNIVILPNTSDMRLSLPSDIETKQIAPTNTENPLVLLHLSLLIESKGYIGFLEACEEIASEGLIQNPIEIILCGPMAFSAYCTRHTKANIKSKWIEDKIAKLNEVSEVTATWLPGESGAAKQELFERSHIFVFPSRFPVEAQPLVLLEAMASGCALVTSNQGEIPSTIGRSTGISLTEISVDTVKVAILELARSHERRMSMGLAGIARVQERFSLERYGDNWDELLTRLQIGGNQ